MYNKYYLKDYIFKIRRKTQITYPKDIALILMFSNAGPGSRIVEAGTGTGALTTALAYHVCPTGHIYTYELRPEFIKLAEKNLERAGVSEYVTMKNKDITEGIDETEMDAVILDLTVPGGMGGQETKARLTEIDKHVKAIVSSGYSNDPVMSNYKDYGFLSAVRKPYVIKELSDAMKKLKLNP